MKKLYSLMMMLALMMGTMFVVSCGGDDDDENGGGGGNGGSTLPNTISITMSSGAKYVTTSTEAYPHGGDGYLTSSTEIYFHLKKEDGGIDTYHSQAHIILNKGEKNISDFPLNYDLNNPTIDFGSPRSSSTKYKYASGSVKVISNNGTDFTLQFDNYQASRSGGETITVNGKLYVVKE